MLAVAYKQEDETTGKHYAFAHAQRGKEREIQWKQKIRHTHEQELRAL